MNELNQFLHHLHDTLILLGGDKRIAELLNHPELITTQDVTALCWYTDQLMNATKDKLVNINTRKVTVSRG
jgi:hypothetical protein